MDNGLIGRLAVVLLLLAMVSGCDGWDLSKKDDPVEPEEPIRREFPLHVSNTVAQHAGVIGHGRVFVHGYGLVIGLGKNGSSEVPPHLEEFLVQYLLKNGLNETGNSSLTPSRVLRDMDTAVVLVRAAIPTAATKDTRFDVYVTALSATGTRSLDGGILMPTELRLEIDGFSPGEGSRSWAVAGGPIMVNPYVDPTDREESVKLREGVIVGGGQSLRSRSVSLQLYRPDYSLANRIQERVNAQFPGSKRVANAENSSLIELAIPPHARHNPEHFLELITHLPLRTGPVEWEMHSREIVEEMRKDDAAHEDLSLVLEAYGRKVLPLVGSLYDSPVAPAAFYSSRVGARLGDHDADPLIVRFASEEGGDFQLAAVKALGEIMNIRRAEQTLKALLESDNDMVRVAAYEALLSRGSNHVITLDVGGQFMLDIVATRTKNMIYATRTKQPRIVLFGKDLRVAKPVFFSLPQELVTLNSEDGDDELAVWRRLPGQDRYSESFHIKHEMIELIRTLGERPALGMDGGIQGLGLTYGQIVTLLHRLSEEGHISAPFLLQQAPQEHELIRWSREARSRNIEGS